ncbi:MAG: RagB/SusD family nutrient uptake outer membrane protein [Bacteroidetes bacterium]|nr:RagB/SusD family nutrient uptake outer membrane protein [Bacteroidota bacterium]
MNKIFKIQGVVAMMMLLLTSCLSDLNPKNLGSQMSNSSTVYNTPADYLSGLAKVYASFALSGQQGPAGSSDISGLDEGFGVYLRVLWNAQELTTDEAVIAWNDQTIKNFHWQTWTPSDVFNAALYSRIMYTVSIANEFIRQSAKSTNAAVKIYSAEARFCRALAYWHALDLYGNPPFITEANLPGAFYPAQTNPTKLFQYIESELTAIAALLPAPGTPGGADYGHATKAAVYMLQAKLYLNAETYLGAGNGKYTECLTALNNLFALNNYSLAPNYLLNFAADNYTSPELIFTINYDGSRSQSYGGMDYIIHAEIGGNMNPANFGMGGGWAGTRTTSALVGMFATPVGGPDGRAQFFTNGQNLVINDIGSFNDGYAIQKFTNLTSTGGASASGNLNFVDTDFPMFRLADAYLMYAEAVLRGGSGGDLPTSLGYVNQVLTRAYGNATGNIILSQLTLPWLLDERARELYWEGHRRTDLIRFGQYTNGTYQWPWKGNVPAGQATDAHLNLFPIPSTDLSANPTLKQNQGY